MHKLYVISGVTGMTGNEVARQIISNTVDYIIGFDNFFASSIETVKDLFNDEHFKFFQFDINNYDEMQQIKDLVIESKNVNEIIYINCAAVVHTEHFYHIENTFETNLLGMKGFLHQAIEVGAHKFINCSTSEVYSMQSYKEGGVREDDYILMATAEHSQRTSYAVGKLMTEFVLKDAVIQGKIKGCSIRFANVYSKNELLPKHIIPHIIYSLENNGKVVLLENAKETKRTFLHNIDSCKSVLALSSCEKALDGSVYNVATQEEVSIIQLVNIIAECMGIKEPVISFEGYRESDPRQRVLCTEKITSMTGWRPEISLHKGIKQCIEYYGENIKDENIGGNSCR